MTTLGNGKYLEAIISSSLPAVGAFTGSNPVNCLHCTYATLNLQYVSGAATGSVKFYVQTSPDGTNWFDRSYLDTGVSSSASGTIESNLDTHVVTVPKQGSFSKSFGLQLFGAKQLRFQFAEVGAKAAPGVVSASVLLLAKS